VQGARAQSTCALQGEESPKTPKKDLDIYIERKPLQLKSVNASRLCSISLLHCC